MPDPIVPAVPVVPAAVDPNAAPNWIPANTDAETVGYFQNRGWDKKTAPEAALEAGKAHRELQAFTGVPAARLIKLPADITDVAGWNGVYARLGAIQKPEEVAPAVADIKHKDGTVLDPAFVGRLSKLAVENHWSKDTVRAVAKDFADEVDTGVKTDTAADEQKLALETKTLRDSWGANWEVNNVIAKRMAEKLGSEYIDAAKALEGQVGYAKVMQLFYTLGTRTGEDKWLRQNLGGDGTAGLTKEGALSKRKELMADLDWSKSYLAGDVAKNQQIQALLALENSQA